MGKTSIEWTDYSWNPIRARNVETGKIGWHCEHKSDGCRFCYAEVFNRRLGTGIDFKPGHRKDIDIFLDEDMLLAPLRWKKPRKIFVCSMTDLGAQFVTDEMLDRIIAIAALCPQHTFIMLTKRPERMREYLGADDRDMMIGVALGNMLDGDWIWNEGKAHRHTIEGMISLAHGMAPDDETPARKDFLPLPNVWLGTSCEDQNTANERIPQLLAAPAAVRFLSCEPLLAAISLEEAWHGESALDSECWGDCGWCKAGHPPLHNCRDRQPTFEGRSGIDWVIVGGESGCEARPMHPDWARFLRDQCAAADVPFFFKQWGEWAPGENSGEAATRAERTASLSGNVWHFSELTPRMSQELHRDDEPDLYRIGKVNAGRFLDGVEHNEFPRTA